MNCAFVMNEKSIILRENELQIYINGYVTTQTDYDLTIFSVMNYLWLEGFLETHHMVIENVHVFDGSGRQVFRENCV